MKEYRPPAGALAAHLFGAAFFLGVGVWGAIGALQNADGSFPQPVGFAIFFVVASSVPALFLVVLGFKLHTERLLISSGSIELQRWGRGRVVAWDSVTRARWRTRPNIGSIVLYSPGGRFAVTFANYRPPGRRELIAAFREQLPPNVQEGWPAFEFAYFPDEAERRRRRERIEQPLPIWADILLVAAMLGCAGAVAWYYAEGWVFKEGAWWVLGIITAIAAWTVIGAKWRKANSSGTSR